MQTSLVCFSCRKNVSVLDGKVSYREECPHCRSDVHVCKNCDFWDVRAYNECRETSADRVVEKERSNLCDYFQPRKAGVGADDAAAKARAAAEALFKKK